MAARCANAVRAGEKENETEPCGMARTQAGRVLPAGSRGPDRQRARTVDRQGGRELAGRTAGTGAAEAMGGATRGPGPGAGEPVSGRWRAPGLEPEGRPLPFGPRDPGFLSCQPTPLGRGPGAGRWSARAASSGAAANGPDNFGRGPACAICSRPTKRAAISTGFNSGHPLDLQQWQDASRLRQARKIHWLHRRALANIPSCGPGRSCSSHSSSTSRSSARS